MLAVPRGSAGFGLRVGKSALIEKLDEIFREKNIQRPIDGDAHLLFGAWQFAPIDPAPQKPREEAGKVYAKDSCDTGATADRSQRAECLETKGLFRRSVNARYDVLRDNFAFARSVLRCRRTIFSGCGIGYERAIAERPQSIDAVHFEISIHLDAAAFFRARHNIENRIWRDASGPNQCRTNDLHAVA